MIRKNETRQLSIVKTVEIEVNGNKNQDIRCHHCGGINYRRKGFDNGRRIYFCKDCERLFILGAKYLTTQDSLTLNLSCPECEYNQFWKCGKTEDDRQRYKCKKCKRSFTDNPHQGKYEMNLELSDDVWLASDLGVSVPNHRSASKFIFRYIEQDWLKDLAKKFIKYMSATRKMGTLLRYITEINSFSHFLTENCYYIQSASNLTRPIIIDYIHYLNTQNLVSSYVAHKLCTLSVLFNIGTANQWFDLPAGLILNEDFPKHNKCLPRFIPEEIIRQLNQYLEHLPEPIMRGF